ncbi:unnamed protein product, partial [Coregonus sp. 'balchen']
MVENYGTEKAIGITLMILRRMNRHDVAEKLERDYRHRRDNTQYLPQQQDGGTTPDTGNDEERETKHVRLTGSSRVWDREASGSKVTGITKDEDLLVACPSAGLFQCSITGLVFRMEGEGEVLYRTVPWNRRLLAQRGKRPAGPLFNIDCPQKSVCQLHLPHSQIHSGGGCDFLSVAHVTDDIIEFLPPHEITETHIIINITGFCDYGLTKDEAPVFPIQGLVLLFYQPFVPEERSILNMLLLPSNVVRKEVSWSPTTPETFFYLAGVQSNTQWEINYYPTFQLFFLKEKEGDELVWNGLVWLPGSSPQVQVCSSAITGRGVRREGEGEVLYRTVPWNRRLLAQRGQRPAGPLFNIDALRSLLPTTPPHSQIHSGGGCDFLSVAHVTDDIIEFLPLMR